MNTNTEMDIHFGRIKTIDEVDKLFNDLDLKTKEYKEQSLNK